MMKLPGIDADRVWRYGRRFYKLIRTTKTGYENMMRQDEDRPEDPNHHNVIELTSDDDDEEQDISDAAVEVIENEESQCGERSGYFQSQPEVEAFNAQCNRLPHYALSHCCFNADFLSVSQIPARRGVTGNAPISRLHDFAYHEDGRRGNRSGAGYGPGTGTSSATRQEPGGFARGGNGGRVVKRKARNGRTSTSSSNGKTQPGPSRRGRGPSARSRGAGSVTSRHGIGMMPI